MDFSDHRCCVACALKKFCEVLLLPVECLNVVDLSVDKAMLTSEYHGTTWCADGIRYRCAMKDGPFPCQTIDVRRIVETVPIGTYCLVAVIVAHNKDDVWQFFTIVIVRRLTSDDNDQEKHESVVRFHVFVLKWESAGALIDEVNIFGKKKGGGARRFLLERFRADKAAVVYFAINSNVYANPIFSDSHFFRLQKSGTV